MNIGKLVPLLGLIPGIGPAAMLAAKFVPKVLSELGVLNGGNGDKPGGPGGFLLDAMMEITNALKAKV